MEDTIAALDGDWSEFSEAERAAFGFARRLTHEPHRLTAADVDKLRKHYTALQIMEIILSVAGNNSTTRWKEAIGVPQEPDASRFVASAKQPVPQDRPLPLKSFLTPTSEKYKNNASSLAPRPFDVAASQPSSTAPRSRPPLESREATERALADCRTREPYFNLVEQDEALALLPTGSFAGPLPQWVRLLANFPRDGKNRILVLQAIEDRGDLTPLLKAQVNWIAARQDRAWYSLGRAQQKLRALEQSDDEIYKLDGPWNDFEPREQAAFAFARKLTANPELLADDDVAQVRRHLGDRDTLQLISYLTNQAFFNRVTEASGLRLEDSEREAKNR